MTKLGYLHEPGVLYNLASRYELNDIYVSYFLFETLEFKHFQFLEKPHSTTLRSNMMPFNFYVPK